MFKKLTGEKARYLYSIIYAAFTAAILICVLFAVHISLETDSYSKTFLFLTFFFLFLARLFLVVHTIIEQKENKIGIIKDSFIAFAYLTAAILALIDFSEPIRLYMALAIIFFSTMVINRVGLVIENKNKKKIGKMLYNAIIALAALVICFVAIFAAKPDYGFSYLMLILLVILITSLIEVLAFAFSKIQLRGLLKIMRQTYVFEIIYGLIILTVSFSFYFMIMEEKIETFGDGLWYSFAVITTIGFGDVVVKSGISRVLTVILGTYGIIVVASITSVIVNFYNEVKSTEEEKKDDDKKENE